MNYISIDVATKSLAITILHYNRKGINLNNKSSFNNIRIIKTFTEDLAPGRDNKSIKELERVKLVTDFINTKILEHIPEDTMVIIEKQISTTPSYIVYITLLTLFINIGLTVKIRPPAIKNQLVIDNIKITEYYKKTLNAYTANKQHSKAIYLAIKDNLDGQDNIIINKKYITDHADTITQFIGYIK